MLALAIAAALALGQLPPQNQPVNITQVSGSPVGSSVPVHCVSGCGGGGSGGGASDQGSPGPTDAGWPVVLVDQDGNIFGTGSNPIFVSGGGGGGGTGWDGGVIIQYPVAIASLWDGGVVIENFPEVQAVSQSSFPWVVQVDPDGGPLQVECVSGCGGGGGPADIWDGGVLVQNDVTVLQGGTWDVTGSTVAVVQDTSPWVVSGSVGQSGNWAFLMVYDGGTLPVSGSVSVSFPAVQSVSIVDGGIQPGYDAGYLAYSYSGPLPADTSYQTSCTIADVFCGTTSTSLGTCTGGKWQDFQNQSSQSIYICPQAGCSAPTAIDAGTVVGEQVQPLATYFANGSAQYWCVVPTSAQVSPDAGTVVKCCK